MPHLVLLAHRVSGCVLRELRMGLRGLALGAVGSPLARAHEALAAALAFSALHTARLLATGRPGLSAVSESLVLPAALALASIGGRWAELRALLAILATTEAILLAMAVAGLSSDASAHALTAWSMAASLVSAMRLQWARQRAANSC